MYSTLTWTIINIFFFVYYSNFIEDLTKPMFKTSINQQGDIFHQSVIECNRV